MKFLKELLNDYYKSPEIFQAGRYWKKYEDIIISEIENADLNKLRSGDYTVFATFGFSEYVFDPKVKMPLYLELLKKITKSKHIVNNPKFPYSLSLKDIREMAFLNCINQGKLTNTKSIVEIETSDYGSPTDLFQIEGRNYTMQFLSYYSRLCYFNGIAEIKGNEIIVELGSGSCFQIEILKKIYPDLTVLCFDLPYILLLGENYLCNAIGEDVIVKSNETIKWESLDKIEKGKVHMIGNWKFPLLKNFRFDIFWNAASFGEMEPHIVKNYLSYILGSCDLIYLLQARKGKESTIEEGVVTPIKFEDYDLMLQNYKLLDESDAFQAHRKLSQSGGYFQAVWKLKTLK